MAVVLLNGAPRSGKTALATAVQARLPGTWMHFGVDAVMAMTPSARRPGMGLRPDSGSPEERALRRDFYRAWAGAAASFCEAGFQVVADVGIYEDAVWRETIERLAPLMLLTVGVICPLEVVVERRAATGWEPPHEEKALIWQEAVHLGKTYDLTIDTSEHAPEAGAERILQALRSRGVTGVMDGDGD